MLLVFAQEHVPWGSQSFFESRIVKSGNLPASRDAYRASHLLSKVPLPPYFRIPSMACVQKGPIELLLYQG